PGVPAGPRSGRVTGCRIGAPRQSAALFSPFAGAPFQILLQPFDQRVDRDMPQEPQLQTTWTAFLDRLRSEIPDDVFCVWLQPLRAVALSEGVLYIHAPKQTRDWV